MTYDDAQTILASAGVQFDGGLTDEEFRRVERTLGFQFPPDLRAFLSVGLPVSDGWVDWRGANEAGVREALNWPFEGICFDIEHNAFWLDEWGEKPPVVRQAFEVARNAISHVPVLIPIYYTWTHRENYGAPSFLRIR